jgi:hypothetical protein
MCFVPLCNKYIISLHVVLDFLFTLTGSGSAWTVHRLKCTVHDMEITLVTNIV